MAQTAVEQGATLLNYVEVTGLTRGSEGFVEGATARDRETGAEFDVQAKCLINATGPFCDSVRRLADPDVKNLISPSQGIHLVFDRSFLAGDSAIMVPHTTDGRVMFAIPWHGHTLVGTTDTPISEPSEEPTALDEEISFVLENAQRYLHRAPTRSDILSVFTGIRPLVRGGAGSTAALSRDHTIYIDQSGLLTITGGKWTTYRHMAEDCVNQAATLARLPDRSCVTRTLRIHGHASDGETGVYGSDAGPIAELAVTEKLAERLHPALPYTAAEVVWAVRHEMARTIEDVLARRTRALFLNAAAALAMAPRVGQLMAAELGWDNTELSSNLDIFRSLASKYTLAEYNV
jgi:glycerol-3-phosphate dehydrogenase